MEANAVRIRSFFSKGVNECIRYYFFEELADPAGFGVALALGVAVGRGVGVGMEYLPEA
jgi:hypothetical protein